MKTLAAVSASLAIIACASAHATPCDQVQAGIDAKIKAHGAQTYSLEVVAAADVKDQKVVGSCQGGSKKIVYSRTPAVAKPAATAPATPAASKS